MSLSEAKKAEWIEAGRADHERRQQLREQMLKHFSEFSVATGGRYKHGEMITRRFGRRTWAIEVWQECDEWHAGLYIVEQVKRHNYWWEQATGKTAEEAINRLRLRVGCLWEELAAISEVKP